MAESIQERQQNELEAIKAIFSNQIVRSNDCLCIKDGVQCWAPIDCVLSLGPQQGSIGPKETHTFIDLHIICNNKYPEDVPRIILEKSKGLSSQELSILQADLEKLAEEKKGEVVVFEIANYTMNFLHEYNKPDFQSFYDEMVQRQQIQQKREMERKKAFKDKERLEILLEIQNKQEAIKKEIKSRRNSNIQFEDDNRQVSDDSDKNLVNSDKANKSPVKKTLPTVIENDPETPASPLNDKNVKQAVHQKYGETESEDYNIWNLTSKSGSRIESEFEVLDWIGEGAFGDVIKVRNRLDGCLYAIKRIELTSMNTQLYKKITREVKLLSRLNHENVVRYYNSWIETSTFESVVSDSSPVSVKSEQSKMVDMLPRKDLSLDWSLSKATPTDVECSDDDDSSDDDCWITFMPGYGGSSSSSIDDVEDKKCDKNMNGDEADITDGDNKISSPTETNNITITDSSSTVSTIRQFMYIQMEYCEKSTLRSAIDEGLYEDNQRVWRLLREIVEGLCHIHQQAIIHRDLKPVNIFIDSEDHVKIGDFGLATTNILHNTLKVSGGGEPGLMVGLSSRVQQQLSVDNSNITSHTGQVGTALYVAPELNTFGVKASYNQKVDIYSLGVIFFEMCYHPLNTSMERLKVLTDLRQPDCVFPPDFPENEKPQQAYIIRWLLNHDPSKRPNSQDLLQSDKIPPPQMEDAELQEMVRHTLSNPQSKAYKHLVAACFKQEVSAGQDITYDMSSGKGGFYLQILENTIEHVKKIFKRHGAISLITPLFTPCRHHILPESVVRLMTRWGGVVMAPHNLRAPFARYLAQNPSITQMKRYAIDRVYRERRIHGCHPRELYECAFDIVTPIPNGFEMVEAELLSVVWEVLNEFPVLMPKNCLIRLNHTSILRALLLHCSIEPSRHEHVCSLLSKAKIQDSSLNKSQIESFLLGNGLSEHTVALLFSFIDVEISYDKMLSFLRPVMKKDTALRSLCKEGLHNLELVISYSSTLGVKCPIMITPGLVCDMHQYSGMMCQVVWDQRNKRGKIERNVIAAGGRYDCLIQLFRQMLDGSKDVTQYHQYAAGISLSLDRLVSALQVDKSTSPNSAQVSHNSVSSPLYSSGVLDAVVCSLGQNVRRNELLSILRDLWASNIRCSVNDTQNLEEIQSVCMEMHIPHIVLLKDTDPGYVRVRSLLLKGKTTSSFQERRMLQNELVEHLQRLIKLQQMSSQEFYPSISGSSSSGGSGSSGIYCNCGGSNSSSNYKNDMKFSFNTESVTPQYNINIICITLDKLTAATRRRYESQVLNSVGNSLQRLSSKVRIEVLAFLLETEVIKMLASQIDLDSDFDLSSVIKWFPRHKKYLNKIIDQIQEMKCNSGTGASVSNVSSGSGSGRSATFVLILFSLSDNFFKIIM
ncbi:eukaryotic translation initiation factor 2 alpha kinase Gcn2 [Lycorma delicatula]|uniref:eukaryotic translation initiation factor 2 alpha kinase Gcn2 n=1 Tax=Lycorma delicatula TaxID=130591 RepID=UPI003F516995